MYYYDMNTFLPYADFVESGKSLDNKRLGKQRVEVLQMLNKINGITKGRGWTNHPCTKMWQETPNALVEYGLNICEVWKSKGFKDTCYEKIKAHFKPGTSTKMPGWLGRDDIHLSHQSKLIQKDRGFYKPLFPTAPENLEYVWPV